MTHHRHLAVSPETTPTSMECCSPPREMAGYGIATAGDYGTATAVNLERLAASSAVIACGAEGSGDRLALVVKPAAVKQELSDVLFGHA